jgi:hypothetical protein
LQWFLEQAPEKRRHILLAFGALALIVFVLLLITLLNTNRTQNRPEPQRVTGAGIPHEELFFPAEPDFLPEFILEREPRLFWSEEEIEPFWKTPEDYDFWLREITVAVERLLEGVP